MLLKDAMTDVKSPHLPQTKRFTVLLLSDYRNNAAKERRGDTKARRHEGPGTE